MLSFFLLGFLGLVRVSGQTPGQAAVQTATPAVAAAAVMPKKPEALMLLGWRVNGVEGVDKPRHLKATYQTFDADGKPTGSGTYEEWWASPEKWKWSYSSAGFNQARYRNGDKTSITGDPAWVPFQDRVAVGFLRRPLAGKEEIEHLFLTSADRRMGAVPLHCVLVSSVAPELVASEDWGGNPMLPLRESFRGWGVPTTCFNPDSAVARVELFENGLSSLFDDVVEVDGQYVAKDIWIRNGTVPVEHLTVTMLEVPARLDESDFAVPADARAEEKYSGGRRIAGKTLTYPPLARTQKIKGMVMIRVKITKTGDIADPEVISGPKELRSSTLEAVKTWKYEPYRLNGQPVEVSRVVSVIYLLGR
ncbi:MAG: energy transducer TonB [Silvibacterium sp.]